MLKIDHVNNNFFHWKEDHWNTNFAMYVCITSPYPHLYWVLPHPPQVISSLKFALHTLTHFHIFTYTNLFIFLFCHVCWHCNRILLVLYKHNIHHVFSFMPPRDTKYYTVEVPALIVYDLWGLQILFEIGWVYIMSNHATPVVYRILQFPNVISH